ncbi:MAG TPA: hypothetical protein VGF85_03215 [Opitutaceae bacterium]
MTPSDIHIDAPTPAPIADPEWDEAFMRVQSYLRAYGMESPIHLNNVASGIIQEAHQAYHDGTPGDPVGTAMRITQARIGAWFARSGKPYDWSKGRDRAQGRLALIVADLPKRWRQSFLSPAPLPSELASAMSSVEILPGPEVKLSNMTPEPLEFGILDSGEGLAAAKRMWLPARLFFAWILIFGFFGIAWAASH